jgi:hypothetical protein
MKTPCLARHVKLFIKSPPDECGGRPGPLFFAISVATDLWNSNGAGVAYNSPP